MAQQEIWSQGGGGVQGEHQLRVGPRAEGPGGQAGLVGVPDAASCIFHPERAPSPLTWQLSRVGPGSGLDGSWPGSTGCRRLFCPRDARPPAPLAEQAPAAPPGKSISSAGPPAGRSSSHLLSLGPHVLRCHILDSISRIRCISRSDSRYVHVVHKQDSLPQRGNVPVGTACW